MEIRDATPSDIDQVRALFRLYEAELAVDLSFQNFEQELRDLPGEYSAPHGALLVAAADAAVEGCAALRRWSEGTAEMKRLFIRREARGSGRGRLLVDAIVTRARDLGYRTLRLDVLPHSVEAIALYLRLGFTEIEPYRHNPVSGARYFELSLQHP